MIARTNATTMQLGRNTGFGPSLVPSSRLSARNKQSVLTRFREEQHDDHLSEAVKEAASHSKGNKATDTKLSPEELEKVFRTPAGHISPKNAELRADLGSAATDPAVADYAGPLQTLQAFDGPIPETFNGRLCMLAIPLALWEEFSTTQTIMEQVSANPARIVLITLAILIGTCAPILRGFTRKEQHANRFLGISWSPQAENWNGRLAMLGFVGILATELITDVNTLQAWGLQDVAFGIRSSAGL